MLKTLIHQNSSIAGIFFAAVLVFFIPLAFHQLRRKPFLAWLLLIPVVYLLLHSNSRSGWIGCIAGIFYFIYVQVSTTQKKRFLIGSILCITGFVGVLLLYKNDSSRGRELIYTVSLNILKDSWPGGIGLQKTSAIYNEYQADYFSSSDINGKAALLADNTFYLFNDYLQWIVETGLAGALLLAGIFTLFLRRCQKLIIEHGPKPLILSAQCCIICIAIAAGFSYPLQTIPLQFLTLTCCGILLYYPAKNYNSIFENLLNKGLKGAVAALIIFFFWNSFLHLRIVKKESTAFGLQLSESKKAALEMYEALTNSKHLHGYNFFLLSQRLYYTGRTLEAYEAICKCMNYYTDNNTYLLKGQIEADLGKYDNAEQSYRKAVFMVPNRMASRFELMNFYHQCGDTTKAKFWANSILSMPVKVPSAKTEMMLKATRDSLSNWSQLPLQ